MASGTTSTTATEVQKNFGFFQDEALKRPVFISKNGRPKTVLISYDEFVRLKRADRQAYGLDDLPPSLATAILEAEVPDELVDPPT